MAAAPLPLMERLSNIADRLRPLERKVAELVLRDPAATMRMRMGMAGLAATVGVAVVAMAAIGQEPPELEPSAYGPVARPDPATATAYAAATESYLRWSARWAAGYRTESALSEQHGTGVII